MALIVKIIFLLIVFIIGFDLHVRNSHLVTVNYYGGKWELPVSLLISLSLLSGAALGILAAGLTNILRYRRKARELRQAIGIAAREGGAVRSTAIKDASS